MPPVRAAAALVIALAACFSPVYDQPRCGTGDTCPGALVCDDGLCVAPVDPDATQPIDARDGPSLDACTARCEDRGGTAHAVTCTAADEACPLGCSTEGGVHCARLVPSNGVTDADLAGATGALVLDASALYQLNTDTGLLRTGAGVVVRAAGPGLDAATMTRFRTTTPVGTAPGLAVLAVQRLTIPGGTVLRATGSRALVIVAAGAIDVDGEIDLGAGFAADGTASVSAPGPGGGRGALDAASAAQGCAPGGPGTHATASNRDTGGGGGGLGLPGGRGGSSMAATFDGGSAVAMPMLGMVCAHTALVPLRGGSGGGRGQAGDDGGGGGGALQLTSMTSIALGGVLFAAGAGGDGSLSRGGGGGGGAGGAILLEAPTISITGAILTGGGGGGDGDGINAPGQSGQRDGAPAASSGNGGRGATGPDPGAGEFTAADGNRPGGATGGGTGGGGGGSGVIHLRSITPSTITGGPLRPRASTSVATTR